MHFISLSIEDLCELNVEEKRCHMVQRRDFHDGGRIRNVSPEPGMESIRSRSARRETPISLRQPVESRGDLYCSPAPTFAYYEGGYFRKNWGENQNRVSLVVYLLSWRVGESRSE